MRTYTNDNIDYSTPITTMEELLKQHNDENHERFLRIEEQITQMQQTMKSFIDAWNQAKGVITFVKWTASVVGSLAALFLFIKEHWK